MTLFETVEWLRIETAPGYTRSAVYQFRIVVNDCPLAIPRFLGTDAEGVLVIGSTSQIHERWKQAVSGGKIGTGHSSLNWLYYLSDWSPLAEKYPSARYEYRFAKVKGPAAAETYEAFYIHQYVRLYGEAPRFNSIVPKRYEGADWRLSTPPSSPG